MASANEAAELADNNDAAATHTPTHTIDTGTAWLLDLEPDIDNWQTIMTTDANDEPIDWDWVRSLDIIGGIGVAKPEDLQAGAASDVHELLAADMRIRERVEALLSQCNFTFMSDFDRVLHSYRLPRALAYANRRLTDQINALIQRGVEERRWITRTERDYGVPVVILTAIDADENVSDVQDRAGEMKRNRSARMNANRNGHHNAHANANNAANGGTANEQGQQLELNVDGAHSGNGNGTNSANAANAASGAAASTQPVKPKTMRQKANEYDWRDMYLPGRDIDTVMGIDIETTGIEAMRDYVIDVGFEYMNMKSDRPSVEPFGYKYDEHFYNEADAYGQSRLSFGVPELNARLGNDMLISLNGIDVRKRADRSKYRLFDEWPAAQRSLLRRLEGQPYVAHNARFEHSYFMLNVEGYAESYRDGLITIVDTMPMSRKWDEGSVPSEDHPYGDNTLEAYAKRQGALDRSRHERHLGLEDAHIMLVAMKHHLQKLREQHRGPWGKRGRGGVGGKSVRRRS